MTQLNPIILEFNLTSELITFAVNFITILINNLPLELNFNFVLHLFYNLIYHNPGLNLNLKYPLFLTDFVLLHPDLVVDLNLNFIFHHWNLDLILNLIVHSIVHLLPNHLHSFLGFS